MEFFEKLDKDIYAIVIYTTSLLKSLKKIGIEDSRTRLLSKFASNLYFQINNLVSEETMNNQQKVAKINQEIVPLLIKLSDYMIDEFKEISKEITNEKAEIYNRTLNLLEYIKNQKNIL